jgi:hypothetical protein
MYALSASELLNVWECEKDQTSVKQALALLVVACPEESIETLAKLSIGRRDSLLLTLREWTFGSQLTGIASCPECCEHIELSFDVTDIRITPESAEPPEELTINANGFEVRFHLPGSQDLAAITGYEDIGIAQEELLKSCIIAAHHNGREISSGQLPSELSEAIAKKMAESDPQSDIELALSCPTCGYQWQAIFDIVSFFWSEINAWSYRILHEVHTLARAYKWREADILAMSPLRRQFYLDMVS